MLAQECTEFDVPTNVFGGTSKYRSFYTLARLYTALLSSHPSCMIMDKGEGTVWRNFI